MNRLSDTELIEYVVDRVGAVSEWDELIRRGERDPSILRELAETMRDHAAVRHLTSAAADVAERIEAPIGRLEPGPRRSRDGRELVIGRLGRWSGWAVAAVVALAWLVGGPSATGPTADVQQAGLDLTARDAFRTYLERGKSEGLVVDQMPTRVVVGARQLPTGDGYELLYLQQVLEKAVVPDLYEFTGQDERGVPTLVRYDGAPGSSM